MLTEHQLRAQGFDSVSFREEGGGGMCNTENNRCGFYC